MIIQTLNNKKSSPILTSFHFQSGKKRFLKLLIDATMRISFAFLHTQKALLIRDKILLLFRV